MDMTRIRRRHTFTLPDDIIAEVQTLIDQHPPPAKLDKSTIVEVALREYVARLHAACKSRDDQK